MHTFVLSVSLPLSFFVCEHVIFLVSYIVLNLGDQNAASYRKVVVIVLCDSIF